MHIELKRTWEDEDATAGKLYVDGEFVCYTLEDEARTEKVYGETRIPAGLYDVKLRKEGGFHERYKQRFPDMHRGMLHITDIVGFQYVLIHIGNTDDDTAGCILVGLDVDRHNFILRRSTQAYKALYPMVRDALERGEDVKIHITEDLL